MSDGTLPDWERVVSAASHLQELLPDAVLVGGTAAAMYAHHRLSTDADHVLTDLRERFNEVLAQLESVAGWKTARVNRPVQILGSLDGIETGVRQLIRSAPLDTVEREVDGYLVKLPTKREMLRIKAVLILRRNATRDYIDFVALADLLGEEGTVAALASFDELYPQANEESALHQLEVQLANPLPFDLEESALMEYSQLDERWRNWQYVKACCIDCATSIFNALLPKATDVPEIDVPAHESVSSETQTPKRLT